MRSSRSGIAWLRQALALSTARPSLSIALVFGTVLNLINRDNALVMGAPLDWLTIMLTYGVPFPVATSVAYCVFRSCAGTRGDMLDRGRSQRRVGTCQLTLHHAKICCVNG